MKKTLKYLVVIIGVANLLSCDDLLETNPKQSIDLSDGINDPQALKSIVIGNYDIMQDNDFFGAEMAILPEVMSDNFDLKSSSARNSFRNQFRFVFRSHINMWNEAYDVINHANAVLFSKEVLLGDVEEDDFVGQAFAQRAIAYFALMNVYSYMPTALPANPEQNKGGVPLLLEPQLAFDDVVFPERASITEVYNQIRVDLDSAILRLDNGQAKNFFTQAGAQGLASRVALYDGRWQDAIDHAQSAIDAGIATLSTRASYQADWLTLSHPENLFFLMFNETEPQGQNGPHNLFTSQFSVSNPNFRGDGDHPPAAFILDYLENNPDDIRNELIRLVQEHPTITPRSPVGTPELIKYNGKGSVDMSDPISIIRLSEMYLNIAEAEARLGNEQDARDALDVIKSRSLGPSFVPTASSGQDLIDDIFFERRLELMAEGHRFFDLKRSGLDIDKTRDNVGNRRPNEIISFQDPRILAPIPTDELDANSNLEQNFGY